MEKVSEMIESLCPEGVKKVPLWKLTAWDKKFNAVDKSMQKKIIKYNYLLAKELDDLVDDSGDIRILYTTEDIAYTTEKKAEGKISEGEIVAIPWGGNPTVKYYNGRFVTGDNRIATSLDTSRLENKYLYYWMLGQIDVISTFYRGAGIKHPSMYSVLTMEIPLPSLPIQQEIVRILDSFTSMITNLETELASRQKQYEYYRKDLLSLEINADIEQKCLSELSTISRGKRVVRRDLMESGTIPVYQNSLKPLGYSMNSNYPANTPFVISAGAAGEVGYSTVDYWGADDCFSIVCGSSIDSKYAYYWLKTKEDFLKSRIRGGAIKRLSRDEVENLQIIIPSLDIQKEIVKSLDTFESLIQNVKQELEARKKQYEYYREKLLTFE